AAVGQRHAIACRQFHEKIVWMLSIYQRCTVSGLSRLEQQRVTLLAHRRVCRGHSPPSHRSPPPPPPAPRPHPPAAQSPLFAPRPPLLVVDQVREAVGHGRPFSDPCVHALVRTCVGLPTRSRRFARNRIRTVSSLHVR